MLYISQTHIYNGQNYNASTWSFYALSACCIATPVIFQGVQTTGTMITFVSMAVGTKRNSTAAGVQTFPFACKPYLIPADVMTNSSQTRTYLGWFFSSGRSCIASSSQANSYYLLDVICNYMTHSLKRDEVARLFRNSPRVHCALRTTCRRMCELVHRFLMKPVRSPFPSDICSKAA